MKNIIFLILIAFALLAAKNSSAEKIKVFGTITEEGTSNPISSATVLIVTDSGDTTRSTTDISGHYEALLPDISTTVEDFQQPETFKLYQNYPNPFNPTTIIQYELNNDANVSIEIFNIAGQFIRRLFAGYVVKGAHSVVWDGRDNNGGVVAAGVYIYRLEAGKYSSVKKMLLLDGGGSKYNSPKFNSSFTSTGKSSVLSSKTFRLIVIKEWYSSYERQFEMQDNLNEIKADCVLSLVNLFPLSRGNEWNLRKLNLETQSVLAEVISLSIPDTINVNGIKYNIMTQYWNRFFPDTLLVREDGFNIYWNIDNKEFLVCDFKAPINSFWTISLPAFKNNEARTLKVQKVQLDDFPLYEHQYLKYSFNNNIYWYERYKSDQGINLIHSENIFPNKEDTFVVESYSLNHKTVTIDYDYPSFLKYLNTLFK